MFKPVVVLPSGSRWISLKTTATLQVMVVPPSTVKRRWLLLAGRLLRYNWKRSERNVYIYIYIHIYIRVPNAEMDVGKRGR